MAERDDFLAAVAARLPLPEAEREEILDELWGHLVDAEQALLAEGLDSQAAQREAVHRLGRPDTLAEGLIAARCTTGRLLVAVGGGLWAAAGRAVVGLIVGWAAMVGVVLLVLTAGAALSAAGWKLPTISLGQAVDSLLGSLATCLAACLAGRAAVRRTAERSLRDSARLAWLWAVVGGLALLGFVLFVLPAQLDWPTVFVRLVIPLAFALGALTAGRVIGLRIRTRHLFIAVGVSLLLPLLVLTVGTAGVSGGPVEDERQEMHFDLMGPEPPGAESGALADGGWSQGNGVVSLNAGMPPALREQGWRDLRFEGWRGQPGMQGGLGPAYTKPFAIVPAEWSGEGLVARMHVNLTPGVENFWVTLTGVGRDGRRYRLSAPTGGSTVFEGTVWDWFVAVTQPQT